MKDPHDKWVNNVIDRRELCAPTGEQQTSVNFGKEIQKRLAAIVGDLPCCISGQISRTSPKLA